MQRSSDDFGFVVVERSFVLFDASGDAGQITARIGMPVGVRGDYCCPTQLIGVGDERVRAPDGEGPSSLCKMASI